MRHTFISTKNEIGLVEFLSDCLANVSANEIKRQLKIKEISVNGKKTSIDIRLNSGDRVDIFLPASMEKNAESDNIEYIYEDDNLAIVNKPILCDVENHLCRIIRSKYPSAMPVHRLDRNTTGLVIFSLNNESYAELLELIKNHQIEKTYIAHIMGCPKKDSDTITVYLKKNSDKKISLVSARPKKGYVQAITKYSVIKKCGDYSIVEILLVTGRMHQIRASFSFIGHPIIGDGKYGDYRFNKLKNAKYQKLCATKIKFSNIRENCVLSYLNNKEFELDN